MTQFVRKTVWFWLSFIIILGLILCCLFPGHIGVNVTASEPYGFYWLQAARATLPMHAWVVFRLPAVRWITKRNYAKANRLLLKQIGAVPGEWLFTRGQRVYACARRQFAKNCRLLGQCVRMDEKGRRVYCQHWKGFQIPPHHYYLQSTYSTWSLDSRYFGLVDQSRIYDRAHPLLTW